MGKKKQPTSVVWLFPFTRVLHPFCISLNVFFSRGERIHSAEIRALLFKHPESSEEVSAARWPLQGWEQTAQIGPISKCKADSGSHFNPDSLSTWSHNSAPIYSLYRQASVKTLPRFEEMFDTIVSSSFTFNCWSENLFPSESSHIF